MKSLRWILLTAILFHFSNNKLYADPVTDLEKLGKKITKGAQNVGKNVKKGAEKTAGAIESEFSEVTTCVAKANQGGKGKPLGLQLKGNPKDFIKTLVKDVSGKVNGNFPSVMKSQIDNLRSGFDSNNHKNAVHDSIEGWKRAAEKHGMGKCLIPAMNKYQSHFEAAALELKDDLHKQFQDNFNKHVAPALHEAIGKGLAKVITGKDGGLLLTERELKAVVSGVYSKYLVKQLNDGEKTVDDFKSTSMAQLKTVLSPKAQWPELFELELLIEIGRAMGHKYIDSNKPGHGGYLVNQAVGIVQLSEGGVEKLTSAICGLIPEAGAAICALIEVAIDALWNQGLVPLMKYAAKEELHKLWDMEVDQGMSLAESGKSLDEIRKLRKKAGPLSSLSTMLSKDMINALADKHLKEVRKALDGYNKSVVGLAGKLK